MEPPQKELTLQRIRGWWVLEAIFKPGNPERQKTLCYFWAEIKWKTQADRCRNTARLGWKILWSTFLRTTVCSVVDWTGRIEGFTWFHSIRWSWCWTSNEFCYSWTVWIPNQDSGFLLDLSFMDSWKQRLRKISPLSGWCERQVVALVKTIRPDVGCKIKRLSVYYNCG